MTLTVGSLFSGIGGIDLGLERAGMKVAWQVEIDPWCQKVLAKHWPDVERFADVREVGAHNLAPVDVIAGGFPCQDISDAGKRGGITASRSGLWTHFARIVRELRPRYVLVENVAALRLRGLDVVLRDLSESGYDAEWDCVPAAAVGAPHLRDRLWLVAYADGGLGRRTGRSERSQARQEARVGSADDVADTDSLRREWTGAARDRRDGLANSGAVSDADGRRLEECAKLYSQETSIAANGSPRREHPHRLRDQVADSYELPSIGLAVVRRERRHWAVEPPVGRVAHGIPGRVDRLRGLGNAVVPQVVEWIGRRIVEADAREVTRYRSVSLPPSPTGEKAWEQDTVHSQVKM